MPKLPQKIANIVFGDIVGRGLNFFASIYLARILGKDAFGMITFATAILFYGAWASDLGLSSIGVREMAKEKKDRLFYSLEIFGLKAVLGIIVLAVIALILPFFHLPENQTTVVLRYCLALIPLSLQAEWFFNGKQQFGLTAIVKGISSAIYLALILLFIHSPQEVIQVPLLYALSMGITAVLYLIFGRSQHLFDEGIRSLAPIKNLLRSSFSIGFGTFFGQMMQFLPPMLIFSFLGSEQAGLYGAAFRIIIIGLMFDRVFVGILLPNFTKQWQSNQEQAKINLAHSLRIILTFGGSVALGLSLLSPWITTFLYGAEYSDSALILSTLGLFLFFTYLNSIFSFGLVAMGHDHQYFKVMATGGIFSIFLMFFAAMFFDLWAVSLAIALGEMFIMLYSYHQFSKHIKLAFTNFFLLTLMIAGGLHFSVVHLFHSPWLHTLLAMPIFVILCLSVNIISRDDLLWIKSKLLS